MSNQTVVKVSEQDVLARQAVLFVLAYIEVYKGIFGNHNGYRSGSVQKCFRRINQSLPIPLRDLGRLDTQNVFPRDEYMMSGYRFGNYVPPFSIFPSYERSSVQSFINRFDISKATEEMVVLKKSIQKWLLREEMIRARKAIVLLKARTRLPSFGKKYPELKRALEKL